MKLLFRTDAAKRGFARKYETGKSGIVNYEFSLVVLVSSVIVVVERYLQTARAMAEIVEKTEKKFKNTTGY